jgi:1,4-alpha-glucan branching enzyme
VWLNEKNEWIYPHLRVAQERMTELANRFSRSPNAGPAEESRLPALTERALKQAARELLLAQASDWPFILRAGTSADYARRRVTEHLQQFGQIYAQLMAGSIEESSLSPIEARDNIFPDVNYTYWSNNL